MTKKNATEQVETILTRAEELLDHCFQDRSLLLRALTHPSAVEDLGLDGDYERLEFLGDSLLGAIVAKRAYDAFPKAREGKLTRIKVALVSGSTLASVAEAAGLTDVIIFGPSEIGTHGRGVHSALENVYEALVAALYLDGGLEVADAFVARTLLPRMNQNLQLAYDNPKSVLQERLQAEGITPAYELVSEQGPPHDRIFRSAVFAGEVKLAEGEGRSKKEAESRAARMALQAFDVQGDE